MTERNIELTRRKILASVGAVGAAGAAAGLGTSAYFSDQETFANNQLTAGELDLKVDWQEHYSDWSDDENDDLDSDVEMEDPEDDEYVGLPDPDEPLIWVHEDDLEQFMDNTTIEAFPDGANDGTPRPTFYSLTSGDEPDINNPCDMLADVPQDLGLYNRDVSSGSTDTRVQNPGRTRNEDTYDSENDEALPLINLTDVKPGDFGEVTLSTHLCSNPGYLWLQMPGGLTTSENGVNETEAEDEDEDQVQGTEDEPSAKPGETASVELADKIKTTVWYDDDCDNVIDSEPEDLVTLAIVDTSGSTSTILSDIRQGTNKFVKELEDKQDSDTRIYAGVIRFDNAGDDNDVFLEFPIQNISNYVSGGSGIFDSSNLPNTTGNSPIPHALDVGREYLNDVAADLANNSHPNITDANIEDPNKQILVVSDGGSSYKTSGSDGVGTLQDSPGGSQTSYNGNTYRADFFDSLANESAVELPDPDGGNISGTNRAETALVARDIDGEPFLPPSNSQHQSAGPKSDLADNEGPNSDPADISGANDVTVRAVAVYPPNASSGDKDRAQDTMMAYATSANAFYDLPTAGPTSVANNLVTDLLGATPSGTAGEQVIFDGISLRDLAEKLDPNQMGPVQLDGNRGNDDDECFAPGVTHCFGFAWWLPLNHGNEVQTDSVEFDLGFYTEQCRHNDGENPAITNTE